jgi:hypothetical protein
VKPAWPLNPYFCALFVVILFVFWQLKKVLRALCPPGHQPLLLECAVTRQQAEATLVFAEAEAAQALQSALHRQLVQDSATL